MDWLFSIVLFVHVAGAILAFGPSYAFLVLGPMGGSEPRHLNFALRVQKKISSTLIAPLALLQGVTGLTLVALIGFEILTRGWLLLAIALYVVLLSIGFLVLIPALGILIPATSAPPPASSEVAGAPAGPPPHVIAARNRARLGGMINAVLILVIVFLMVTKPF